MVDCTHAVKQDHLESAPTPWQGDVDIAEETHEEAVSSGENVSEES